MATETPLGYAEHNMSTRDRIEKMTNNDAKYVCIFSNCAAKFFRLRISESSSQYKYATAYFTR